MHPATDGSQSNVSSRRWKLSTAVGISFLLAVALLLYFARLSSSPPNLRGCTRIEIEYRRNALEHLFPNDTSTMLSPEERDYLASFHTGVVTDPDRIRAFARVLTLGHLSGHIPAPGQRRIKFTLGPNMHFVCYRGDKRVVAFSMSASTMVTDDSRAIFDYPFHQSVLDEIDPPEIRPFRLRKTCKRNLYMLYSYRRLFEKDVKAYPDPATWCDTLDRNPRNQGSVEGANSERVSYYWWPFNCFVCPGSTDRNSTERAGAGLSKSDFAPKPIDPNQCDFAMNPNCGRDSPPDTVLLFESKRGWNQHGGPELFTFDNHEPRGGCVLLNGGAVKFIRTEEELKQLRWK